MNVESSSTHDATFICPCASDLLCIDNYNFIIHRLEVAPKQARHQLLEREGVLHI